MLGCTPFIALAYFFLWFLPPFTSLRGLWYITFYCVFQALATVSSLLNRCVYEGRGVALLPSPALGRVILP